ncbi:MAG: AEC family transporter [Thermodesulfovibrio sp.]|nr:AEC family transporter [Thermodesulfovibrio sp.]
MILDTFFFIFIGLLLRILLVTVGIPTEKIDSTRDRINYFVFYYIIPIICFKTTYTMPLTLNHFKVSFVAILTIISCIIISSFIYRKIFSVSSEVLGSIIISSSFGNVLYIGLPVLTKLYGEQGISYALTYDLFASTPLVWSIAVAICMKYGYAKSYSFKDSFPTIIRIPAIWGLLVGLIFRKMGIYLPDELIIIFKKLSSHVTYLMLLIVGVSIKTVSSHGFMLLLPAIAVKIIISPLLGLFFATVTGLSDIPYNVCIIQAGMPTMLMSMIFARIFGTDLRTSVEMIFFTTVGFFLLHYFYVNFLTI